MTADRGPFISFLTVPANGRREVKVDGTLAELSRKEFDLLALLMSHAGQVVTRDRCIDRLWWDQDLADTRTLDTHVKRLRRKIERDPANPGTW